MNTQLGNEKLNCIKFFVLFMHTNDYTTSAAASLFFCLVIFNLCAACLSHTLIAASTCELLRPFDFTASERKTIHCIYNNIIIS